MRIKVTIFSTFFFIMCCYALSAKSAFDSSCSKRIKQHKESKVFRFDTYKARGWIGTDQLSISNNKHQSKIAIRAKVDSIIWISLSGPMGIEFRRFLLGKRKIKEVDFISKTYKEETYSRYAKKWNFPIDFKKIQYFLFARYASTKRGKCVKHGTHSCKELYVKHIWGQRQIFINSDTKTIEQVDFENKQGEVILQIKHNVYTILDNGATFPTKRTFIIKGLPDLCLNLNRIQTGVRLSFPFNTEGLNKLK